MKLLLALLFYFLMIHESSAQISPEDLGNIIEQIRIKYAPDKRTAIFNINYTINEKTICLSGETNIFEAKKELLSRFENINVIDKVELFPSKDLGKKNFGIANLSVVNVRTKPSHSAELTTQVLLGSNLKILRRSGEWYLVQCEDDYIGWMDDDGVFVMDHLKFEEWNQSSKIIVTSAFSFSYSAENKNSTPISDVVQGNLLKKISQDNDFTKVQYPDGREAFISNTDIQEYKIWLDSRKNTFDAISLTAHRMMGIPYVWGGTSIKGLDCSGFTKIVFHSNGIELPRDASQQVQVGDSVDIQNGFDSLIPGDLLFFGNKDSSSGKERITHVAIYLGDLEFIHASGRVRINSFDKTKSNFAEDRLKTFIRAKRILSSLGTNGVKLTKDINEN
jgi:gamma-D-glutamyl-L-lysine dipeptidyl-peptidase